MVRNAMAGRATTLRVQLVRYGIVGLGNTAVGLSTILALQEIAGFDPYVSNAIGFAAGLVVSFVLNRGWTFGARDNAVERAVRFVAGFLVAYAANLATVTLFMPVTGAVFAQVAGTGVYSMLFFALCRWFVFAGPARQVPA